LVGPFQTLVVSLQHTDEGEVQFGSLSVPFDLTQRNKENASLLTQRKARGVNPRRWFLPDSTKTYATRSSRPLSGRVGTFLIPFDAAQSLCHDNSSTAMFCKQIYKACHDAGAGIAVGRVA
jgi:hypothetical protein